MGLFSFTQEIAIDLGTANTIIMYNNKIVVDEPSVVAMDSQKKMMAVGEKANTLNLLRPQTQSSYQPFVYRGDTWVDKVFKFLDAEKRGWVRKFFGLLPNYPRADDRLDKKIMPPYVARFQEDIRKAKENADLVLFYPHVGGQFNPYPGAFSEYIMDKALEAKPDAILASHAHMVQKAELRDGVPCFFSMGNFN
ncbi:MAG: CapA family protein, partial [Bacteroidaceae bacterium]|nr:CapA family protein [Bacteroidaceae bacterium]